MEKALPGMPLLRFTAPPPKMLGGQDKPPADETRER
jgi:hypothetical protein